MINWLDLSLIVLVTYFTVMGWRRGLVRQFFDFMGIFAAYFIALRYGGAFILWLDRYLPLARWFPAWFNTPLRDGIILGDVLARLLGFLVLFIVVRTLLNIFSEVLSGICSLPLLGTFNGLGGLALGAVKGVLIVLILVGVLSLLSTPFWIKTLEGSVVAESVHFYLPIVYEKMVHYLMQDIISTV